jgi:hypothetical protein
MANTIQVRRGPNASLPTLNAGELGFSTDTHQVYIGDGVNNHELARLGASNAFGAYDQTFDTTTLVVDAANDRVGVGKTPDTKLDVAGNIKTSGQVQLTDIATYLVNNAGDIEIHLAATKKVKVVVG